MSPNIAACEEIINEHTINRKCICQEESGTVMDRVSDVEANRLKMHPMVHISADYKCGKCGRESPKSIHVASSDVAKVTAKRKLSYERT